MAIRTARLLLRKLREEDAPYMFRYGSSSKVTKYLPWKPYDSPYGCLDYIKRVISFYNQGDYFEYAIQKDGIMIGTISVSMPKCELGYVIDEPYWGQGLIYEAADALLEYLFLEKGLTRIIAKHDLENPNSGRVMRKLGMSYVGDILYEPGNNAHVPALCALYEITREQFFQNRKSR